MRDIGSSKLPYIEFNKNLGIFRNKSLFINVIVYIIIYYENYLIFNNLLMNYWGYWEIDKFYVNKEEQIKRFSTQINIIIFNRK